VIRSSNIEFKKEQAKEENLPMGECPRCKKWKHLDWYKPKYVWICLECIKELEISRQIELDKNYNPSHRNLRIEKEVE